MDEIDTMETEVCDVTFLDVRSMGDVHVVVSGQRQMGHL